MNYYRKGKNMYKNINKYDFIKAFHDMGRKDQFSYDALTALYEYYDSMENVELDVIAICCDWTEYPTAKEAVTDYCNDTDYSESEALDYLNDQTYVITFETGILVAAY